ncbi:MAG TPA: 6-phosphogluconolactonase [Candidatus Saccharimonadia bacterium]|nr:6-phosphogluconolactonase [Candidatus Saccharimonadia bacterium]
MSQRIIEPSAEEVVETAARLTLSILNEAISSKGEAIWVLAGGTAPMATCALLAAKYADHLDWSKVTLLIGDERCVPADHADSSWHQIDKVFIGQLPFQPSRLLRPSAELGPEAAASAYQATLQRLPLNQAGIPRFDLVWLGLGEDGHTLSLFPGHPSFRATDELVIPVHNSPKPPPERISFTLRALQATAHCLILTTGSSKAPILQRIMAGDQTPPIAQAAAIIERHGGQVQWIVDEAAATSPIA